MGTKFKQAFRLLSMAALGLLMAACTTDDITTEQSAENGKGIPFTATLSNGGSATRALSGPNSSNVITAKWAVNDEVALVYKVDDETKVTKATVTAVSDGTATITAELADGVTTGTDVTLIYPYSAVNLTAGDDYGKVRDDVFKDQAGTLAYISENCDLRKGEGKITLSTGSATLKENVTMDSQIAIWILSLKDNAATPNDIIPTKLDVYFGGMTSSVTTGGMTSRFDMAVPAGTGGITFFATTTNSITNSYYIFNKSSVTLAASTYYQSTVTLTQQTTRTITASDGEVTLNDGDIVTGTGGANTQLKIADGATVTLAGVTNMDFTTGYRTGIECQGSATIILADGTTNTFKGHWERAAVYIPSGNTLTIRGGGTLIADNSSNAGAGIGGSYQQDCGNIVIEGGNITAKGNSGAGIGCGNTHSCGTITIKGGTINATGSDFAAGIGSGQSGSCSDITISGGTITATGGAYAAGIGSGIAGDNANTCGAITISGGTVKATGGGNAAGIGSGYALNYTNECGAITISGSAQVKATGGVCAAGIGTGSGSNSDNYGICGAISITAGTVEATGGDHAAGIGSGSGGKFTSISIGSGITRVTATRSDNISNVPIGKGENDQGSGAVTFGGVTMHNGTGDSRQSNWAKWPEDGGPFGGIWVTASDYGTNNGRTWTLTPQP